MIGSPRRRSYSTATEAAFDTMKGWILEGRLAEGERIDQEQVARELGVSRLPVRMALERLEGEGLVQIQAHRGVVVSSLSGERLNEVYLLRAHLEGLALDLTLPHLAAADLRALEQVLQDADAHLATGDLVAFLQCNRQFHMHLYQAAHRPILLRIIGNLWDMSEVYQRTFVQKAGLAAAANREHREILAALAAGDGAGARAALDRHNYGVRDVLQSMMGPGAP